MVGGPMSTAEFALVILAFCGDGKGNADMDCVDYYNNCVINYSIDIKMENVNKCKKDYKNGLDRIVKLKKEFEND
jgi:hypothetical protein